METNLEQIWDSQRAMMISDIRFAEKVKADCKVLESEVKKVKDRYNSLVQEHGLRFRHFVNEYVHKNLPIVRDHDHRFQVSPSRAEFLSDRLNYYVLLLKAWDSYELSRLYEAQEKKKPTVGDVLKRIESMTLEDRNQHFKENPELTEMWLLNRLEQRRSEEKEYNEQEKERAIKRYRRTQEMAAEKLSQAEDAKVNMRNMLERWVKERQTR